MGNRNAELVEKILDFARYFSHYLLVSTMDDLSCIMWIAMS